MALPSLNESPKYELVVPSTGKKLRYRPFLVKEQKVLLLAYESQDKQQIINAILDTVAACTAGDIDVLDLTTFDIDYIFTQIRSKSVGEKVDLQIACSNCEQANDVQINLEDIKVEVERDSEIIKLNDQISIKMKYPNYNRFMLNSKIFEVTTASEMIIEIVLSSIDSIMTEEENISAKDETREDLLNFVESMNAEQFEKVSRFVESMPVMKHEVNFKCVNCGEENTRLLQGIDDFF
jgi:ribosomal protein L44E